MVFVLRLAGYISETSKIVNETDDKKRRIEATKRDIKEQGVQASIDVLRTKTNLAVVENRSFQPRLRPIMADSRSLCVCVCVRGGGWRVRAPRPSQDGVVPRYLFTEAQCQAGECPPESGNQQAGAEPRKQVTP